MVKNKFCLSGKLSVALVASALLTQVSFAQSGNAIKIDEVKVVTAAGFEQKITDAPATISVVSRTQLEEKKYSNVAEAIEDMEGVDVRMGNTGKTGGQSVSIRGMGSDYTLILVDGKRQRPAGSVTPNGFGETQTNFMPPMSAIDRIEVIKGPMSTLYGSDAMGGVVNIITRKVANEWTGSVSGDVTHNQHSGFGRGKTLGMYVSGPLVKEMLGLAVRGNVFKRSASDLKFNDGKEVSKRGPSPVEGTRTNVGAKLTFTPFGDNHEFWLDAEIGKQRYNNDDSQLGELDFVKNGPDMAPGYTDKQRFNRKQFGLGYNGQFEIGKLEASLTRSQTETIGRTLPGKINTPKNPDNWFIPISPSLGKIGDPRTLEGTNDIADVKFLTNVLKNNYITIGGQFWSGKVNDGVAVKKFSQKTWAFFAEDEWQINDQIALTVGGRYDHHNVFGGQFSPRFYAVWNPMEEWTFKGGVSKGYKAPTVNDLYDGINGVTKQGRVFTIGTPTLKPETSVNYEAGVYYNNSNGFKTNLTAFYNKFSNKIASGNKVTLTGVPNIVDGDYKKKINVDRAVTQGIEAAMTIPFLDDFSLGLNYTFLRSEIKSGKTKGARLINTPDHMGNVVLNWQATDKFKTWLKAEYRGERYRFLDKYQDLDKDDKKIADQIGMREKGYTQLNLGGRYQFTKNFSVSATIYNLLDRDFLKANKYTVIRKGKPVVEYANMYSMEGRRLWVGFTYNF